MKFILLFLFQTIGFASTTFAKIENGWSRKMVTTNEKYPSNYLCWKDGSGCADNGCVRAGGTCFSTGTPPAHSCFCRFSLDELPPEVTPNHNHIMNDHKSDSNQRIPANSPSTDILSGFEKQLDSYYVCVVYFAFAVGGGLLAAAFCVWCCLRRRNAANAPNQAVWPAGNGYEKMKNEIDYVV